MMASDEEIDQVKVLLVASPESPAKETIQRLLTIAARSSQLDILNSLLTQYPSIPLNEEVVRTAVNTGSIPIFEALLARDSSIINMPFDHRGSPLIVACSGRQRIEYLRFLLEKGADPNQDPDAAAFPLALVAALYKDTAAINLLLQYGARLEHSGALAAAATLGNEPMLHCLLDRGARIESDVTSTRTSSSPLHIAVKRGRVSIAKILLQHGADPYATNSSGFTAIEVAEQMRLKGEDISEMLEALGAEQGS